MKAEIAVGLFVTLLVSSGLIYSMGQDDSTQVEQTSQVQSSAPFLRDNAPKEHLSKKSLDSSIPLTSSQFEDFVIPLGYPVEIHWVTTSDGYILKLYRIPGKKNESPSSYNNRPRVPMFLQHGLLDSSDTFILNQEDKAIAFTLANSGFDVWLGNTRGNKYSLQNIHFNYKTEAFWDFTWNDMADKDLPTMLTYVTEETGYSQVVYVGHSQGTVITWAGASDPVSMDIVNEKIALFIALGPATYVHYSTSLLVQAAADARLAKLLADFKFSRFLLPTPWGDLPDIVISEACKISELLCEGGMRLISDEEPSLVDNARDYIFFDHFPSGTGVKNMEMWAQQIRKQSLQKFDYGSDSANMNAYGVPSPPVYDLANMKIPTVMFVGKEDKLADLKDAEDFRAKLNEAGNSLIGFHIADCGHLGFLLDTDVDYWYVALSYIKEYATRIADNHDKKH